MQAIGGFEQAKGTLQEVTQDESINPTIYNIIRWLGGSLGQTTNRPSV